MSGGTAPAEVSSAVAQERKSAASAAAPHDGRRSFIPLRFESDEALSPIPVGKAKEPTGGVSTLPSSGSLSSTTSSASRIVSSNSFANASSNSIAEAPNAAPAAATAGGIFSPITPSMTRREASNETPTNASGYSILTPVPHDQFNNVHFSDTGFGNLPRSETPSNQFVSPQNVHRPSLQPRSQLPNGVVSASSSSSNGGYMTPRTSVANDMGSMSLKSPSTLSVEVASTNAPG